MCCFLVSLEHGKVRKLLHHTLIQFDIRQRSATSARRQSTFSVRTLACIDN
jgi:hypothetical protein